MTAALAVSFSADPRADGYTPSILAGRLDRVSLVLWRVGPDDAEPTFHPVGFDDARTLVAVWPTDELGILDNARVDDVVVRWWTMPRPWFDQLRVRHRDWHLGRHDLLISDREALPCRDSLWRRARGCNHRVAEAIAAAVATLAPR